MQLKDSHLTRSLAAWENTENINRHSSRPPRFGWLTKGAQVLAVCVFRIGTRFCNGTRRNRWLYWCVNQFRSDLVVICLVLRK